MKASINNSQMGGQNIGVIRMASLTLALFLSACTTINPYTASPAPAPANGAAVIVPEEPTLSTQPMEPVTPVEPSIPLPTPPATTRSYNLSPATRALVGQATTQRTSKNFVQAAATLERALRIEPNNPLLWLEYGELRMDENNFAQAESMGRKALASASGDPRAQANAWRLIAASLKARNRNSEAQQATTRANALSGR